MSNFRVYNEGRSDTVEANRFISIQTTSTTQGTTTPPAAAGPTNLGQIFIDPTTGIPYVSTLYLDYTQPDYVGCIVPDALGNLYIGGRIAFAGSTLTNNIMYYNVSTGVATPLGNGVSSNGTVIDIAVAPNGLVYVAGSFTSPANRIASWNPNTSTWSSLGTGLNGNANSIAIDSNGIVYVKGEFTDKGNYIAAWNPNTLSWSSLGTGLGAADFNSRTLAAIGTDIYVGGSISSAGGVSVNNIAKWNGSTWSALGTGLNDNCGALKAVGNNIYVGGAFTQAGGVNANLIAVWNGSSWAPVGNGIEQYNSSFSIGAISADSSGNLYFGGLINFASGVPANGIVKFDGSNWSNLGVGSNFTEFIYAKNPNLIYASGNFGYGNSVNTIGIWNGYFWKPLIPSNVPRSYAWSQLSQGYDTRSS